MRKLVAIHQPNFLPWLGFFDKLARADVFLLLDSVQFPRTSRGTWINRVKLLVGGRPAWVTIPIARSDGSTLAINEVRIDDSQQWRRKLQRTIEHSYRRAPGYDEVAPLVDGLLATRADRIAEFNEANLRRLAGVLGLDTSKIVRSSDLEVSGQSTELLIELTLAVGGTGYMPGRDAHLYQDDAMFSARGLELVPQEFTHPLYRQQVDPFVPGLSIVDALLSCGVEGTRALVSTGPRSAASTQ